MTLTSPRAATLADIMDESRSAASASAAEITLRVERGEPITGTLNVHGRTGEERFCGWMELIAAISVAHGELQQPGGCQRC